LAPHRLSSPKREDRVRLGVESVERPDIVWGA